jgi:hypothetical protein
MWNSSDSPSLKWRPRLGIYTGGKNNRFDPSTFEAVSYNWWTYVSKINGKIVFNAYPYSSSTQSHQRNMRALLKQLKIKIDVEVYMRQSLSKFWSDSLPHQYEEMFQIEIDAPRARKDGVFVECHSKHYKTRTEAIKALKESIKACRQLGAKMTRESIKALKKQVAERTEKRLESARAERAAIKARQVELKPQLIDLGPISLDVFEQANDLNEIDLNQNTNKELEDVA